MIHVVVFLGIGLFLGNAIASHPFSAKFSPVTHSGRIVVWLGLICLAQSVLLPIRSGIGTDCINWYMLGSFAQIFDKRRISHTFGLEIKQTSPTGQRCVRTVSPRVLNFALNMWLMWRNRWTNRQMKQQSSLLIIQFTIGSHRGQKQPKNTVFAKALRTDRRTDGRMDGRTDRPSYRNAFLTDAS